MLLHAGIGGSRALQPVTTPQVRIAASPGGAFHGTRSARYAPNFYPVHTAHPPPNSVHTAPHTLTHQVAAGEPTRQNTWGAWHTWPTQWGKACTTLTFTLD